MTQPGALGNSRYRVGYASAPSQEIRNPPATPGGNPGGNDKAKGGGGGKGRAAPNLRKQATTKLSQISGKLTECRVLGKEIPSSTRLQLV